MAEDTGMESQGGNNVRDVRCAIRCVDAIERARNSRGAW